MENINFDEIIKDVQYGRYDESELKHLSKKLKSVLMEINKVLESQDQSLSVNRWIVDTNPNIHNKKVSDVYKQYVKWCEHIRFKPETMIMFGKYLCRALGVTNKVVNIKGKSYRTYVKL